MSIAKYPAQNLAAVAQAIEPQPLMTGEEIRTLYRPEVNVVRGEDIVRRMKIELEDSYFSTYYKAFVMGHSGVGKSTEMSRLMLDLESKYEAIRFGATEKLSPGSFEPFDVVLLMVMQLIEQAAKPETEGGLAFSASDHLLRPLFDWLAQTTETVVTNRDQQIEAAGGVGVDSDFFSAKVLALFVNVKGELRFAASRPKEQVEYQLRRLSELLRITNRILGEYRRVLREKRQKEWLFLGEDFDKAGVSPALIEKLFLTYGNIFSELDCHLIFSIPATLVYSQAGSQLPVGHDRVLVIPDTPVFDQQHQPHLAGRAAVAAVLTARVSSRLFDAGQMERLIVASGGNLRDLFSMVREAALTARQRDGETISESDATHVINQTRVTYQRRLGESPIDPDKVSFKEKAERLEAIYFGDPDSDSPDAVLHSLLRARAVQEFNGESWCGVHPLVVDLLRRRPGRLAAKNVPKAKLDVSLGEPGKNFGPWSMARPHRVRSDHRMIEMEFDVFLCHNSNDKEAVRKIGEQLREAGLKPWLDEWELCPGQPWQKALEKQIATIGAAAIFVGPDGFGPWQDREKDAFLRQFVKRNCPVIPVILAECQAPPELPIFLEAFTWVDFRLAEPPPLGQLVWGITGKKPDSVLPGAKGRPTLPLNNPGLEKNLEPNTPTVLVQAKAGMPAPSIFVSYAHADAAALKQLKKHFASLEREGIARLWADESIDFGSDWDAEIAAALDGCRFAVPVLSAAFFASKYITGTEIPWLLERQARKEVEFLPIFWSPCDEPSFRQELPNGGATECWLSKWQGLGRPEKTLKDMGLTERERALGKFVQALRKKLVP